MTWLSIDPAKASGVARWEGERLVETFVVKPRGAKGKYYAGWQVHQSRLDAWASAYIGIERVVIERGFGNMATAVRSQGMHIGWHQYACAARGLPAPVEVNVSEWRRVIKEDCAVSWPRDGDRCKALAVQLVKRLYTLDMSADEADAVLLGRAASRMGVVDAGGDA